MGRKESGGEAKVTEESASIKRDALFVAFEETGQRVRIRHRLFEPRTEVGYQKKEDTGADCSPGNPEWILRSANEDTPGNRVDDEADHRPIRKIVQVVIVSDVVEKIAKDLRSEAKNQSRHDAHAAGDEQTHRAIGREVLNSVRFGNQW